MKVEVFVLCDAATDVMGKLCLLGTFDSIAVPATPAMHMSAAVAVRLRFERIEAGEHHIKVHLVDADGKAILPPLDFRGTVQIPQDAPSAAVNFVVNLQQLRLPHFGEYQIDLAVDGRLEASLPLFVRKGPVPPILAGPVGPPAPPAAQ